jgi:hypothetical protein
MGLEDVFREIHKLGGEAAARVVVQEEVSHIEKVCVEEGYTVKRKFYPSAQRCGDGNRDGHMNDEEYDVDSVYEDKKIIDQSRVMGSDVERQEVARVRLQEIYESSEFYSGRYKAGRVLGVPIIELGKDVEKWVSELEVGLWATRGDEGEFENSSEGGGGYVKSKVPDKKKRMMFVEDVVELYKICGSSRVEELLKDVYRENEVVDVRKRAGKGLGKGMLRLFFNGRF